MTKRRRILYCSQRSGNLDSVGYIRSSHDSKPLDLFQALDYHNIEWTGDLYGVFLALRMLIAMRGQ